MAKQLNIDLNVRANTDQAKRAMMELQQSLTKVAGSFASSGGKGMDTQLKAAAQAAQQLSHHLSVAYNADTGKINLNKFSASLKSANTDLKTLSSSLLATGANGQQAFVQLAQNIAAAERPVVSLNSKLTSLWTVLKNTARWQISSTILHGFMGTIQQAYGYAQDLNKSLTDIGIVTGYNTDRMAAFAIEANKAAKSLSTTTNEYAKGSLIYFQQGLGDADVKARTDATVKMANVTGQSMEQTSNQLTAIWNNFAKGSTELELFADKITALGAATASSSAEISEGLNQFAAVANTVGLSYDYATAALATVVATTRQSANVVGTAFKTLFARIEGLKLGETLEDGTDLNKYSEALMAVGVNIKETNGEMKDMDRILDEIGAKWDTLAKDQQIALAQAVAGVRQYTQFIALMDHWDFMQDNLETVANATGTLQKQQERYAESWEAANKRLRASTEAIFTDLIDDKFFIKLTNGFAQVLDGVHDFIEGIGGVKTLIIGLGTILLSTMSQKIEPAFRHIANNIKTMFQTPEQQAKQQQDLFNQTIAAAQGQTKINPETFSTQEKAALQSSQLLAEAKTRLVKVSKELNEQELAQYNMSIQLMESQQKEIDKAAEKVDILEQELDTTIMTIDARARLAQLKQDRIEEENSVYTDTTLTEEEEINKISAINEKYNEYETGIELLNEKLRDYYVQVNQGTEVSINFMSILGETGNKLTNLTNNVNENSLSGEQLNKTILDLYDDFDALKLNQIPQVERAFENLFDAADSGDLTSIQKAVSELNQALEESNFTFDGSSKSIKALETLLTRLEIKYEDLPPKIRALLKAEEELSEEQLKLQNAINNFNPSHMLTGLEMIAKAAAMAGSIAMTISGLKSLFTTIMNPDISGLEKFVAILTSISMIVPSIMGVVNNLSTIVNSFKSLNSAISILNKIVEGTEAVNDVTKVANALGLSEAAIQELIADAKDKGLKITLESIIAKKLENIETEKGFGAAMLHVLGLNSERIAAIGLKAALFELFIVIGAIVAIGASLVRIYQLWKMNTPEEQAKRLAEGTKQAEEAAENANQKYKDLLSTIDNYDNAVDKIRDLTRGTQEYTEAVEEANAEARKLIDTYNLTTKDFSYDDNGIIQFNQGVLDNIQAQEFSNQREARAGIYGQKNAALLNDNVLIEKNIGQIAQKTGLLSQDQANKLINDAQTQGWDSYFNSAVAEQNIAQSLFNKSLDDLTAQEKRQVEAALKVESELKANSEKLISNTEAISTNNKLTVEDQLSSDARYSNMSVEEQKAVSNLVTSRYTALEQELAKGYSSMNRRDLAELYGQELGYETSNIKFKDNKIIFIDSEGTETEVDYKNAANQLAARMASQWINNTVGGEDSFLKQAQQQLSNTKKILGQSYDDEGASRIIRAFNNDKGSLTWQDVQNLSEDAIKQLNEQFGSDESKESLSRLFNEAINEGLNDPNISTSLKNQIQKARTEAMQEGTALEDINSIDQYGINRNEVGRLTSEAGQYSNTNKELISYNQALKELEEASKAGEQAQIDLAKSELEVAKSSLETANAIGKEAQELGIDADVYEDLIKSQDSYVEGDQEAIDLATRTVKINLERSKALQAVQKEYDKVSASLKTMRTEGLKGLSATQDLIEGYGLLKDSLAAIVGLPEDIISSEFIMENLDLIETAITGDEKAAEQLRDKLIDANLELMGFSEEFRNSFASGNIDLSGYEEIENYILRMLALGYDLDYIMNNLELNGIHVNWVGLEDTAGELTTWGQQTGSAIHEQLVDSAETTLTTKTNAGVEQDTATSKYYGVEYQPQDNPIFYDNPLAVAGMVLDPTGPTSVNIPNIIAVRKPAVDVESETLTPIKSIAISDVSNSSLPPLQTRGGNRYTPKGSGGKGGGGGGGKTASHSASVRKTGTYRYSKAQNNVDMISKSLDTLGKAKDRAWGKDKIAIMDQEIERLKDLKDSYSDFAEEISGVNWQKLYNKMRNGTLTKEDLASAGGYLSKDFNALYNKNNINYVAKVGQDQKSVDKEAELSFSDMLAAQGVGLEFAGNGRFLDKDLIDQALLDWENTNIIEWWNSLSADEQALESNVNKKAYREAMLKDWQEQEKQYLETISKQEEMGEKYLENLRTLQDQFLENLNEKVTLKLEISERGMKRLEYAAKILGDRVYKSAEVFKTLFDPNGPDKGDYLANDYVTLSGKMDDLTKAYETGLAPTEELAKEMGQISQAGYVEGLKDVMEKAYGSIDELLDWVEQISEYYSGVIDKAADEINRLTDEIAHNSSVLEHMSNVLSLMGRSMDYGAMGTLLRGQRDIAKSQMDASTAYYQMAKSEYDKALANYEAVKDTLSEEENDWWQLHILDPARKQMNETYDRMYEDTAAFLERANELYENSVNEAIYKAEQAFTNNLGWDYVNKSMEVANSIQDEYLTKTNQIYETNDLMRKLARDIDKTESTAAKAKLKNFSDEIAAMQQQEKLTQTDLEIAKARYELLQAEMALEDAKNAKSIVRLQRDNEGNYGYVYTADQGAIDEAEDNWANKQNDLYNLVLGKTNEYNQKVVQLRQEMNDELKELAIQYRDGEIKSEEEFEQKKQDIFEKYGDLMSAYQESLNSSLFWLNETAATDINEAWTQSFDDIIENCLNYEDVQLTAMDDIGESMQELNEDREAISDEVKKDLNDIDTKTQTLTDDSDKLAQTLKNETIPKMRELEEQTRLTSEEFGKQLHVVQDLIDKYYNLATAASNALDVMAGEDIDYARKYLDTGDETWLKKRETKVKVNNLSPVLSSEELKKYREDHQTSDDPDYQRKWRKEHFGYATGGYTGEWSGDDGKLALLHQKELVLNAEDTKNILSSVSMIRQIADMIDLRAAAQNLTSGLLAPLFQSSASNEMNQNVTITAEFPNVTNRGEIEAAFDNLINRASQFAGRWGN